MKLFELYNKRPLREDTALRASIKLCESMIRVLEAGMLDTIGRKLMVSITDGKPSPNQAPRWATFLGQTPAGAYHWLSNETPVETDDSDNYFPLARKTKFTGYMGEKNISGSVEPIGVNEDGIDFAPDPAFAGVKGISRDTGAGNQAAAQAQQKQQNAKLNATWQKLASQLKTMNPAQASTLKASMQKVAQMAKQRNFTLSPNPEQILGL